MLTYDTIRAAAQKAYDEGRLLAQNPEFDYGYRQPGRNGRTLVCAIGAGLTDAQHVAIERADLGTQTLSGEIRDVESDLAEIITICNIDPADFHRCCDLQEAHDRWKNAADCENQSELEDSARNEFLTLLAG